MTKQERYDKVLEYFETHSAPAETEIIYLQGCSRSLRINPSSVRCFRHRPWIASSQRWTWQLNESLSNPSHPCHHFLNRKSPDLEGRSLEKGGVLSGGR